MNGKTNKNIIIDSSVWIAGLNEKDSQHKKSLPILGNIMSYELIVPYYIYIEVLTVLKKRSSLEKCRNFIIALERLSITLQKIFDNEIQLANKIFFNENNLSFTDCMLLASAKINKAEIITFDKELTKTWEKIKSH